MKMTLYNLILLSLKGKENSHLHKLQRWYKAETHAQLMGKLGHSILIHAMNLSISYTFQIKLLSLYISCKFTIY